MPVQPFIGPRILRVPLQHHEGPPAKACVRIGQTVAAGDCIGRSDAPDGLDVHAPLAGRVTDLVQVDAAWRTDLPAVVIEVSDPGIPRQHRPVQIPGDLPAPSIDELIQAARSAGLTDFQPRASSLAVTLRQAAGQGVDHVIVNTLVGEPMLTALTATVDEYLDAIVRVATWLAKALDTKRCWLAIDRTEHNRVKRMRSATHGTPVRVAPLVNKYPQHLPVLLASTITGREAPPGSDPTDIGALVLQAEALIGLAEAMSWKDRVPVPMTHQVVTVTGPGVTRAGHYRIPLGTRFCDVLYQTGVAGVVRRVVEGGPITGRATDDLNVVVTKQTSAILVLDRGGDRVAAPGPCVRCGWCQEDCPVGLDPQRLLDLVERGEQEQAGRYYPQACVECGLCSYVCPAELPLAQAVIELKRSGG